MISDTVNIKERKVSFKAIYTSNNINSKNAKQR